MTISLMKTTIRCTHLAVPMQSCYFMRNKGRNLLWSLLGGHQEGSGIVALITTVGLLNVAVTSKIDLKKAPQEGRAREVRGKREKEREEMRCRLISAAPRTRAASKSYALTV